MTFRKTISILTIALLVLSRAIAFAGSASAASSKTHVIGAVKVRSSKIAAPTHDEIIKQYSYEQLQEAATYFAMRVQFPKKKILKCDVPVKKSQVWLSNTMHGLIEEQKDQAVKSYAANPASLQEPVGKCADVCLCTAYYGILEEAGETLASSEIHKKNFAKLKEQIKKQDDKQEFACSQKATWLCKSPLLHFLESQ